MKRIWIALLAAGLWMSAGTLPVVAQPKGPLVEAGRHIEMALSESPSAAMGSFVQHTEAALERVRVAQSTRHSPDLDRAIATLQEALDEGRAGHADKAREKAREAVQYIDAAKAALGG